jgi:hypothetical protein
LVLPVRGLAATPTRRKRSKISCKSPLLGPFLGPYYGILLVDNRIHSERREGTGPETPGNLAKETKVPLPARQGRERWGSLRAILLRPLFVRGFVVPGLFSGSGPDPLAGEERIAELLVAAGASEEELSSPNYVEGEFFDEQHRSLRHRRPSRASHQRDKVMVQVQDSTDSY